MMTLCCPTQHFCFWTGTPRQRLARAQEHVCTHLWSPCFHGPSAFSMHAYKHGGSSGVRLSVALRLSEYSTRRGGAPGLHFESLLSESRKIEGTHRPPLPLVVPGAPECRCLLTVNKDQCGGMGRATHSATAHEVGGQHCQDHLGHEDGGGVPPAHGHCAHGAEPRHLGAGSQATGRLPWCVRRAHATPLACSLLQEGEAA